MVYAKVWYDGMGQEQIPRTIIPIAYKNFGASREVLEQVRIPDHTMQLMGTARLKSLLVFLAGKFRIDEQGDRILDYSLRIYNSKDDFEVGHYVMSSK